MNGPAVLCGGDYGKRSKPTLVGRLPDCCHRGSARGGIGVGGTIYLRHEERQENKQKQRQLDERQAKAEAWMTHLADGSYEWQWAPEGWLGTIDIATSSKGDKSAMINIDKYCPGSLRRSGKALESRDRGKVEENV